MRLIIPHSEALIPISRNTNFTDIMQVITPTKADEIAKLLPKHFSQAIFHFKLMAF